MKKVKKEYLFFILCFILALEICFLSPLSGDDWSNFLVGQEGIKKCFGNALGMYFDWEGRIASRILINLLTYNKHLWNITNALVITSIIFLITKYLKPKNKIFIYGLLSFCLLTFYPPYISQVVLWIAGNITYLFSFALFLLYFALMRFKFYNKKIYFILMIILNFITPLFVENVAAVLVLFNIFILIYDWIKNKKLNKRFLIFLIISIISTLIICLSPGNAKRILVENVDFNALGLFGKIIYNLPNFFYYTFALNKVLMILFSLASIFLVANLKNKTLKFLSFSYLMTIAILNIFSLVPANICGHLMWLIYLALFIFLLCINKDYEVIFLIFIGLSSNLVMLLSPTWGYRTSFFTLMFLTIACVFVFNKYFEKKLKILNIGIVITCLCGVFLYSFVFYKVHDLNIEREKQIKNQLHEDVIYIKRMPETNTNINPDSEYHLKVFKKYYGIKEETKIIIK